MHSMKDLVCNENQSVGNQLGVAWPASAVHILFSIRHSFVIPVEPEGIAILDFGFLAFLC